MWRWYDPRELPCLGNPNSPWYVINADGMLFPRTARDMADESISDFYGRLDVVALENWEQARGFYTAYFHARNRRLELEAGAFNPAPSSLPVPPSSATYGSSSPAASPESSTTPLFGGAASSALPSSGEADSATPSPGNANNASAPVNGNDSPLSPLPNSSPPSPLSPLSEVSPPPPDIPYIARHFLDENWLAESAPMYWDFAVEEQAAESEDELPDMYADDFVMHDDHVAGPSSAVAGPSSAVAGPSSAVAGSSSAAGRSACTGLYAALLDDANNIELIDDDDDDDSDYEDGDSDDTRGSYTDEDGDHCIPVRKGKKKARSKGKKYKTVKRLKLNSSAATRVLRPYGQRRPIVVESEEEQDQAGRRDAVEEERSPATPAPATQRPASPSAGSETTHVSATPSPSPPSIPRVFVTVVPDPDSFERSEVLALLNPGREPPSFRYLNTDEDTPFEANVDIPLPDSPPPPPVAGPSSQRATLGDGEPPSPARSDSGSSDLLWGDDFTEAEMVVVNRRIAEAEAKYWKSVSLD
ncbi:hypothetical protein CVT26_001385 [Gymnopilus dilepis]|uniref:Uncharacterized protein n=1 Tax=Gymnopilus dilepis TaxID=231916 RepID=A0A409X5A8_9AGAR|nr:hypothetical protein CVT26_001385 [Gymnopilus dilepis]